MTAKVRGRVGFAVASVVLLLAAFAATAAGGPAARPSISGNTWVGEILTSSPAGDSGVYKWQRCDPATSVCGDNTDRTDPNWIEIPNATTQEPTYTLTSADLGQMIRVQAKGTSLGEQFTPSAPVGPVLSGPPAPPVNLSPPTISGDPTEGKSVRADPGQWQSFEPPSFAYAWERCDGACEPIPGADEQLYGPTSADVGSRLRVKVTASNSKGDTSAYSAQTGEVAVDPPVLGESAVVDPVCPLTVSEPGLKPEVVDKLTNVPVGTRIDVSQCQGELITVRNASGKTQTIDVWGGQFKFGQSDAGKPVVNLNLVGNFTTGSLPTLASAAGAPIAQTAGYKAWCEKNRKACKRCKRILGKKKCKRLWASGDCLCSTSGSLASGTVRGSVWYVQDGPGYTFAKAVVHRLLVHDKVKKKKVLLRQGESYLAVRKKKRKKRG